VSDLCLLTVIGFDTIPERAIMKLALPEWFEMSSMHLYIATWYSGLGGYGRLL